MQDEDLSGSEDDVYEEKIEKSQELEQEHPHQSSQSFALNAAEDPDRGSPQTSSIEQQIRLTGNPVFTIHYAMVLVAC